MRQDILDALEKTPSRDGNRLLATFRFRPDQAVFRGHFPGQPLLPGVFQIELTLVAFAAVLGRPCRLVAVRKAKFLKPVVPGDLLTLEAVVADVEGRQEVRATLLVDGLPVAKLILLVAV